ncbi:hypothetical protein CMI42_03880, partial [Candidatus Pacearchaeota archaeon]|nr:hypothetical protein [Candidatus Pacearchaeota archaeon]
MMGKRFFLLFIGFILLMSGLVFAQYVNYQNPNNVYSTYNQNPNYYNQYSNRNNPVPSNVNYGNRFDNQYYYGNQNVNRNTYVSSGNYNPSRNVQYVDPRYQSNSYGSFNSYSNTGQFGYTQGSGAFGASGLYGYGQTGSGFGFNQQLCANNLNFLIHIAPGGCSPAVVRSDLLEEQNVPVYCKLTSFQSNPLLSGTRIRSMSIRGEYPRGVSGVSYFPGRSALRNQGLFNSGTGGFGGGVGNSFSSYGTSGSYGGFGNQYASSPINDDMGYIVIVLNRQANESSMPDFVTGNITAVVDYDTAGGYGTGNTVLYLDELSEEDWQRDFRESSIWGGRGYVRADSIDDNTAVISMYRDANNREGSVQLREGQTSGILSLGGNYCSAGFRLFLEKISAPVDSALLTINGEQVWVANGDRVINDRCRVNGLEITGGGGKVQISCPGDRVDLSLSSGVASFEVDGNERSISVNERIKDNLFLGYIGRIDGSDFAVVIEDSSSNSELSFADKEIFETIEGIKDKKDIDTIRNKVLEQYRKKLGSVKYKEVKDSLRVLMIDNEGPNDGIRIDNVLLIQDQTEFNNELSRIYYDKSINSYQDLHDFYPSERVAEGEEPLSAQGLYEAFKLSRRFNMNVRAQEFARQLIEGYPDSFWADNVRLEGDNLFKYDRTNARSSVDVDGVGYSVDLIEFRKPSREDASAVFLISGKEVNLGIGDFTNENDVNIQLLSLDDNSADIQYEYDDVNSDKISRREELVMGGKDQTSINGVNVKLVNVELKQQARVRVLPNLAGSRTEVPLSFNIAIEKRLIQLSPERTREFIDNLKKAIKNWEDVNRKLGTVIKTMKGACFATSAILTTKSLFDGYSGTSLARTRVMTGPNGWNKKCEELVSKKEYTTLQQCLLGNKDKIEQDVKALSGQISGTNQIIKGIQGQVEKTPGGIFGIGSQYDQTQIEELFKKRFDSFCAGIKDKEVTLPGQGGNKVTYGEVCKWENLDYKQQREIMTLYNAQGGSEVLESYRENELSRIVNEAKLVEDAEQTRIISEQNANKFNLGLGTTNPVGDKTTYGNVKVIGGAELNAGNVLKNFEKGDQVVRVFIPTQKQITGGEFKAHEDVAGKEVIVKVNEVAGNPGVFSPDSSKIKIYTIEGKEITDLNATASVFDYMSLAGLNKIRQTSDKALVNPMVDVNNLRVQYFDRAPYRGLPSTIPFDIKNGWYVRMNYVTSGFGTPYDESGRVTNYYICNVGPNGKIEFKGGDDICRYYNGVHSDLSFPGMTGSESSVLVGKAQQAIRSASGQYGKEKVTINGQTFETGVSFDDTQGQCTDFMSPSDCNIMFNVCDPVICPASRCDLGGRYRVDNVIQTGIVGSLSLCLPNFQEGIAVPICLSGVHAGLDGYISILNSTVSCLNESLETGRNVGICDEIKSVYMCDFFYKQAVPFVSALFEESFSGSQGVRGGGEYLTVSSAWDNTQGAMDYFTNHYAVNSIQAFNFRQLGQVQTADTGSYVGGGGSFCSSFISSGVTGSSGGFLDALIQPDSPTQYHAWFSEDKLTTATVPPTSHYKVYFNIFAGKDIGSYYSVYLKDLPSTPGIFSTGF